MSSNERTQWTDGQTDSTVIGRLVTQERQKSMASQAEIGVTVWIQAPGLCGSPGVLPTKKFCNCICKILGVLKHFSNGNRAPTRTPRNDP